MTQTATTRPMQKQGIFHADRSVELTDDMAWYFEQIRRYDLLTAQQEIELGMRIEAGDESARVELINGNLRLVLSVARYYHRPPLSLHDIIQEGNIGLMRATELWNYRKGYKFSTYATYWIRQAITRALPDLEHMIHLPCYAVDKRNNLTRHATAFIMEHGYEPGLEELAEMSGETREMIASLQRHRRSIVSLDKPVENADDVTVGELIEDPNATAEYDIEHESLSERISHALACLTDRERFVIQMRFGIGSDGRSHVLQEIAKELGVTREWVRQIEEIAMRKLRQALEEEEEKNTYESTRRTIVPRTF
jgi:RNA polymerase primary sigma factor